MLADKIRHYEETGKSLMVTPAMYKAEYPFLREVDSLALANEQMHLETAYRNFFRDKKVGFPKYKSKKTDSNSYTTNVVSGNIAVLEKGIKLPKLGVVKAKIHRTAQEGYKLKSVTVMQDSAGAYYASALYEQFNNIPGAIEFINQAIRLKNDPVYIAAKQRLESKLPSYQAQMDELKRRQRASQAGISATGFVMIILLIFMLVQCTIF